MDTKLMQQTCLGSVLKKVFDFSQASPPALMLWPLSCPAMLLRLSRNISQVLLVQQATSNKPGRALCQCLSPGNACVACESP